jgi:predicted nucleic acid binding AN1-type Zn finger protein
LKEELKPVEEVIQQVDRKRCFCCKKKVGLLGIECKCGFVHCSVHRLPEEHSCAFNHKKVATDKLKETLVKVYNGKIAEI